MKKLNLLLFVFICLPFGAMSHTIETLQKDALQKDSLQYEIDSIINTQINNGKIPGAVLQIKQKGKVLYTKAYGYAHLFNDQHKRLEQPEILTRLHQFDIASLSKVIGTTTAIMLLADKGLINVDDLVGKYIPAFSIGEKSSITIRQLLSHTSGIYEWYPMYYKSNHKEATYQLIASLPLAFKPGTQRKYSDLGFTILGQIIEIVSKQSLDEFVTKNVFKPIGMSHSCYNPLSTNLHLPIVATSVGNPYEHRMVYDTSLGFQFKEINPTAWNGWRKYTLKGEVNDGNAWYANKGVSGAAGIFSTIDDLQLLVDMLINEGKIGDKQFISSKTIQSFFTKDKFNNGLGWMMDPINSFMKDGPEGSFGHTGFTGTSISVVPSKKLSIIILINRQQMGIINEKEYYNVNPIRQQIFKAVLNRFW
jgi:CubicO group peptidase (beta-lactamase class C family)